MAYHAGYGGDVDDGAAAGFTHFGDDGFRAEEYALGVDVHKAIPVFDAGVVACRPNGDAGVVDEDVHFAVAGYGGVHGAAPGVFVGDV